MCKGEGVVRHRIVFGKNMSGSWKNPLIPRVRVFLLGMRGDEARSHPQSGNAKNAAVYIRKPQASIADGIGCSDDISRGYSENRIWIISPKHGKEILDLGSLLSVMPPNNLESNGGCHAETKHHFGRSGNRSGTNYYNSCRAQLVDADCVRSSSCTRWR